MLQYHSVQTGVTSPHVSVKGLFNGFFSLPLALQNSSQTKGEKQINFLLTRYVGHREFRKKKIKRNKEAEQPCVSHELLVVGKIPPQTGTAVPDQAREELKKRVKNNESYSVCH